MTGIWIQIQKIGINFNMKFSGSKYVNNMNDWCWSNWPFHKRRQRRRRVFNLQHVFNVLHCYCYLVKPLSGCDAKIYARAHTQSFKWTRQWRVCKMRVRVFMCNRRMAKVQMSCSDCRWYIRNPLVVFSLSLRFVSFDFILFILQYNWSGNDKKRQSTTDTHKRQRRNVPKVIELSHNKYYIEAGKLSGQSHTHTRT